MGKQKFTERAGAGFELSQIGSARLSRALHKAVDAATDCISTSIMEDVVNEAPATHAEQLTEIRRRHARPETAAVILGLAFMRAAGLTEYDSFFQCEGTRWHEGCVPNPAQLLKKALESGLAPLIGVSVQSVPVTAEEIAHWEATTGEWQRLHPGVTFNPNRKF